MIAEIVAVKSSTLVGSAPNEDIQCLARELNILGIELRYQTDAGTHKSRLQQSMAAALKRSEVILTTGGLGMEPGDFAKEVICAGLSIPLDLHAASYQKLRAYYEGEGLQVPPEAQRLCMMPRGGVVFPNDVGLVNGCAVAAGDQCIILLPGASQEALPMFLNYVYPFLAKFTGVNVASRVARSFGLPKAKAAEKLGELVHIQNPTVALFEQRGEVLCRVTARANTKAQAANMCTPVLKEIVNRLGDYVYGIDVDSLQATVVAQLRQKGKRMAAAESCTAGLFFQKVNAVPGAAAVFDFCVAAQTDKIKQQALGVPAKVMKKHGSVSAQTAVHMAAGAMEGGEADIGVAITGVAAPSAGVKAPVGLVYVAVCTRDDAVVKKLHLPPELDAAGIREMAVLHALNLVRLIMDYDPEPYHGAMPLAQALKGKVMLCDELSAAAAADLGADEDKKKHKRAGKQARERGAGEAAGGGRRWYHAIFPCRGDGAGDVIRKLLLIIFLLVFLGSAGYVGNYYYKSYTAKNLYDELASLASSAAEGGGAAPDDYPAGYVPKFAALWEKNPDFKGQIKIEGTKVNYPVVQAADNDYYLRRDFQRNHNDHGVPFLDYEVDLQRPSENSIIYGHNMKDGQMFGELMGYKDAEYVREHPIVEFDTVYGTRKYKVAGVFLASTEKDHGPIFEYEKFVNGSAEDFASFAEQVRLRTMVNTGVDIQPGDTLLCLSTCSYEYWEARFVVVGRLLREGESEAVDTTQIVKNPAPLMPDVYYTITGATKPAQFAGMGAWAPSGGGGTVPAGPAGPVGPAGPAAPQEPASSEAAPESPPAEGEGGEASAEGGVQPSSAAPPPSSAAPSQPPAPASSSQAVSSSSPPRAVKKESSDEESSKAESSKKPAGSKSASSKKASSKATTSEEPDEEEYGYIEETGNLDYDGNPIKTTDRHESSKNSSKNSGKNLDYDGNPIVVDEDENDDDDDDSSGNYDYDGNPIQSTTVKSGGEVTVKAGNATVTAPVEEVVARMVQAEMGQSFSTEALKAQAVAAYTNLQYYAARGQTPSVALADKGKVSAKVQKAVEEVRGEEVVYNGKPIEATYFASCAGVTNNAKDIWGADRPYLRSVDSDENVREREIRIESSTVQNKLEDALDMDINKYDEEEWFGDIVYLGNGEYVGEVKICAKKKKSGMWVRDVLGLPSSAFDVGYDSGEDEFIFTVRGNGHGVGMSQMGAEAMADFGYDYRDILEHYYTGARVARGD